MDNFTEQTYAPRPVRSHSLSTMPAALALWWISRAAKATRRSDDALCIVEQLEHRAGKDAEGKTGDGVGIMLQISHKFFSKVADELNIRLGNEREYGVGMFFFPQNEHLRAQAMKLFELVTRKEGLEFLAWREGAREPGRRGPEGP